MFDTGFKFMERHPTEILFSGVDCGFIHRAALPMRASACRVKLDIQSWLADGTVVGISVNDDGARALALASAHKTVKAAADAVKAITVADTQKLSSAEINQDSLSGLTDAQRCAVVNAFDSRISVITGGPGTGKTHTMATIVRAARSLGHQVLLLAPTGKAARRMTEMAGEPARTIHSWIRYPHSAHLVIVDESSMIDQAMFCRMIVALEAGHPKPNVVFVGDKDQLPSVDHGEVLRDLIEYLHPRGKVTTLSQVHRQDDSSPGIGIAARNLLMSNTLTADYGQGFARASETDVVEAAVRFARWANGTGQPWQILSPYRNKRYEGNIGTLNKAVSNEIIGNAPAAYGFRVGDRVIFTENNWDVGYVNGQAGTIRSIPSKDCADFVIESEERLYQIAKEDRGHFEAAWATTVHKAQGSEANIVAIVIASDDRLQTELLYTAITRAKKRVFVIAGSEVGAVIRTERRPDSTTMLGCLLNIRQGA